MNTEDILIQRLSPPNFMSKFNMIQTFDKVRLTRNKERISSMTLKSYRSERAKVKLQHLLESATERGYMIPSTHRKRNSEIVDQKLIKQVRQPRIITQRQVSQSQDLLKLAADTVLKLSTSIDLVRRQTSTPTDKPAMKKLRIKRSNRRQPGQKAQSSGKKTKISHFQVQKRTVLSEKNF